MLKNFRWYEYLAVFGMVFIAIVAIADKAMSVPVEMSQRLAGDVVGSAAAPYNCNAGAIWTEWIDVRSSQAISFTVAYVDGDNDGSTTSIDYRCEDSNDDALADDAGFDIHGSATVCAAGACTSTSGILTKTNPVADDESYSTSVVNLHKAFINCQWTCAGVPDANDTLHISATRISP